MRPGCVFCVKRSLYEEIKDVDDVSIPHDDVFWASSIARGTLFIYQKSLIHFRRHGDNASTADAERSLGRRIEAIEELLKITNWILSTHKLYLNTNYADICKYKNFLEKRRLALKQKQLLRLIGVIISNYRCYATFRNCVADVVYLVKYKKDKNRMKEYTPYKWILLILGVLATMPIIEINISFLSISAFRFFFIYYNFHNAYSIKFYSTSCFQK